MKEENRKRKTGAGKKPTGRTIPLSTKISKESAEILASSSNVAEFVDSAIKNFHLFSKMS